DTLHGELQVVEARLSDLRRRLDDVGSGAALAGRQREGQPPTPEEEEHWVQLSHDLDPGARFSALSRLGKTKSERSVQVSVEHLTDESVEVVWQAIRNLGQFKAKETASLIA